MGKTKTDGTRLNSNQNFKKWNFDINSYIKRIEF